LSRHGAHTTCPTPHCTTPPQIVTRANDSMDSHMHHSVDACPEVCASAVPGRWGVSAGGSRCRSPGRRCPRPSDPGQTFAPCPNRKIASASSRVLDQQASSTRAPTQQTSVIRWPSPPHRTAELGGAVGWRGCEIRSGVGAGRRQWSLRKAAGEEDRAAVLPRAGRPPQRRIWGPRKGGGRRECNR
jgi:hypothetical protein